MENFIVVIIDHNPKLWLYTFTDKTGKFSSQTGNVSGTIALSYRDDFSSEENTFLREVLLLSAFLQRGKVQCASCTLFPRIRKKLPLPFLVLGIGLSAMRLEYRKKEKL